MQPSLQLTTLSDYEDTPPWRGVMHLLDALFARTINVASQYKYYRKGTSLWPT